MSLPLAWFVLLNFKILNTFPFYDSQIEAFKTKIEVYSRMFVQESIKRGLYYRNPLDELSFSMDYYRVAILYGEGFCDYKKKTLYFSMDFDERTFLHEIGHCYLDYAHSYKEKPHIMSWYLTKRRFHTKRKELLDDFFLGTHPRVNTIEGEMAHQNMLKKYQGP